MTPRKTEGIAGPSREVSQRDVTISGASHYGQENDELAWARRNAEDDEPVSRPIRNVFRKTELHGTVAPITPDEKKRIRRRTLQNLKDPDADVTYQQFESVFRNFVCSVMERQDMMAEEQSLHVAGLRQQIDALERRLDKFRQASDNPDVTRRSG
ncbi:MAG: hypothetical protein LUQ71_01360 [Methanoregula sp.]|nr:hypothetical protein [Methanoregula sp.]